MTIEKIAEITEKSLLEWGHHHAHGCAVCMTAQLLLERFRLQEAGGEARVIDGVKIFGPEA